MLRALLISASLLAVPVAPITPAVAAQASSSSGQGCEQTTATRRRRSIMGGILGGIASSVVGLSAIGGLAIPVGTLLSEGIMALLDCREQQQAVAATNEAVRGGVGTSSTWTSESRPNVRGSSTVTAANQEADGSQCLTVTDVVIVDGEETTVPKRMCRAPGASGYARV